ncbi:MAG: hypothetical protein ACPGVG_19295, partial [Mycobacterium sp.]
ANAEGTPRVPTRDLSKQDDEPIGAGFYIEGATNWLLLRNTMEFKALVTIVPGAPNNKNQFHVEKVSAGEIAKLFRTQY